MARKRKPFVDVQDLFPSMIFSYDEETDDLAILDKDLMTVAEWIKYAPQIARAEWDKYENAAKAVEILNSPLHKAINENN